MDKNFFLDVISQKPKLFNAIIEFNCKLLYDALLQVIHEMNELAESIVGFNKNMIQKIALRAISLKKDRLIEAGYCFWDFLEETRRMILVDPETIHKLQLIFGAAIHADALSRVLIRSEVLQLEEILGKDVYQYGLLRGRYQLGTVRQFFLAKNVNLPLPVRIQWHGRLALKICMSTWPQILQKRFMTHLKDMSLPYNIEEDVPKEFPPAVVYGVWLGLKKILLREVAPEWIPYFD